MKKNMQLSVLMHLRYICMAFIIAFGFITLIATGGCGGGGGTPAPGPGVTTVSGTAAAGLPIVGTINIRGSNGSISSSAIESDGSFSVDILALTAPFVMWAEGMSGGKFVRLYSCIAGGGIANVTPATNMIMAMALGDDPATVYADGSTAGAPDFGAIETAKQQIAVRLESVFANMNMPEDFDLMNGSFEANGEGFDALLDTVDMTYDATDKKVAIKDKVTDTTLFEKEVDTGITSVD
ncbi:MAG: hypothetical protein HKP58_03280, partial [Desulfatitalea sp.]|nr:hypothetical protein [Desulfatitalea sp.]NNJ99415.1 hypothetical protein [Desulfatitalea sp.]